MPERHPDDVISRWGQAILDRNYALAHELVLEAHSFSVTNYELERHALHIGLVYAGKELERGDITKPEHWLAPPKVTE